MYRLLTNCAVTVDMFCGFKNMKVIMQLLSFVACVWIVSAAENEIFSSTDQVMQLVEEERYLLKIFRNYITIEEKNLNVLKGILELLTQRSNSEDSEDSEEAMSNPVAAFKLIQRMRIEWVTMVNSTKKSIYEEFQVILHSDILKIPSNEDIAGAALGLFSLQEIYKLYPDDIVKGTFFGEDEAYLVGNIAYKQDKFQLAFHWFLYSLKMLNHPDSRPSIRVVTKEILLSYLSTSAYKFGSLPVAINYTKQLLNLDPTNDKVKHLLKSYKTLQQTSISYYPNIFKLSTKSHNTYEALCRGNVPQKTSRRQRALSCRYSTGGGNPRLILAPLKEEVEWNEPQIIRYHDIISDNEIETLKNLSRPLLSRSRTKSGISNALVSQSGFLDEDDTVVVRVNQRVADATGLSMETAEGLDVQNYGIGGIHEPHYDAGFDKDERIATFLIYMSDVKIGGATVFPTVGAALQPKKGSAVFWYNLKKNGDLDLRIRHAECPVLVGNKWVANKFIHEFGQEFRRPCSLSKWE
ncbi:prolyl 4-hydroxylase subunit alpha-2-like isoform X2 [Misgurnus anguillicaudatus]|uniref:prolyl 4-hydroxylase subunit alpha-2-like isoform X2 n=1 Tax=Misgurnus anguillicaudatus TaxID=75329 RepID=UPI003CCF6AF9